jgi:uncharacterized membrane protein
MRKVAHWGAIISLIALIFLCLLWEAWLAPLKPGGSALMLKALPLLAPLFGILRGKVYTYQWTALLVLAYVTEGIVRAWSDRGLSQQLAMLEVALATLLLASCVLHVRRARPARPASS